MPKRTPLSYLKLSPADFLTKLIANTTPTATVLSEIEVYELSPSNLNVVDTPVTFDMENCEIIDGFMGATLMGIQTIEDLTFLGMTAGGDWEMPVYSIVFFDDTGKLSLYTPKEGNIFNFLDNAAYGNDETTDQKASRLAYKKGPDELLDIEYNNVKLYHDIRKRFGIKKMPYMPV